MREKLSWAASVGCGIVCAVCVLLYTAGVQGQADQARAQAMERYGGDQLEVCVATRDLAPGETLSASDIEKKLWVAALLPAGAVTSSQDAVGSMVSSSILSGEVITKKRLGGRDSALEVPDGLIAVSVPAKNVQAVGGAIAPGSNVDVYATGATTTQRIGANVLVLATSASSDSSSKSAEVSWITLAVKPEVVEEYVQAAQNAELYFTLPGEGVPSDDLEQKEDSAAKGPSSQESAAKSQSGGAEAARNQASQAQGAATNASSEAESGPSANANKQSNEPAVPSLYR